MTESLGGHEELASMWSIGALDAVPKVDSDSIRRRQISVGLSGNEFVLHYQPKVDMRRGTVLGFEALIRWRHPALGLLQPAEFLPLIESHALIETLGDWVIAQAVSQADAWRSTGFKTSIAVNVSPRHLVSSGFMERLAVHLAAYPLLHAGALALEIVESTSITNRKQAADVIHACQRLGIKVALDDFGTGYACLTDLRELPIAQLKLDWSFVSGVLDRQADRAIIAGILLMAQRMGIVVVAEGIETLAQGAALMTMGCMFGQGYAIARPMPTHEVISWVAGYERTPLWGRNRPN